MMLVEADECHSCRCYKWWWFSLDDNNDIQTDCEFLSLFFLFLFCFFLFTRVVQTTHIHSAALSLVRRLSAVRWYCVKTVELIELVTGLEASSASLGHAQPTSQQKCPGLSCGKENCGFVWGVDADRAINTGLSRVYPSTLHVFTGRARPMLMICGHR